MLEFIPASKLKHQYGVQGYFYSVNLPESELLLCRSDLEIIDKNIDLVDDALPDAVFIMMNPGSSRPITENEIIVSANSINNINISLVPTVPDTTQYQLMRVMKYCGWNYVRVINLSDLRDGKSGSFTSRFSELETRTKYIEHSVFTSQRRLELEKKLMRKPAAPLVCAWGVSDDLNPLITRCLDGLGDCEITGLLKDGTKNKYYHPLPTLQTDKLEWVNNMVSLINA